MDNLQVPQCWQDVQDALSAGIDRLILFGPPGTGKTFAGMNYGDTQGGAWRLICTEDMTNADVTGHYIPNGNEWKWTVRQSRHGRATVSVAVDSSLTKSTKQEATCSQPCSQ